MEWLQPISSFISGLFIILAQMAPYLLLGFFFAGLLHAFIPRQQIESYLNGNSLRPAILASLFGIPLPLCSCGVIPTGIALYRNGASKQGTVSFLISTPQTGVDSIIATYSLLGLPFAVIRPIAALITGVIGGYLTGITEKEQVKTVFSTGYAPKKSFAEKLKRALRYGFIEFVQDISKWLVIGLILAALVSAVVPQDYLSLLNVPPLLQMVLILLVSIPIYVCATGSIPLAAVLLAKGLSPGAAFVFLMAGPATNAATITMITKVLGRRSLVTYLLTIIAGAIGFGLVIDYALPNMWINNTTFQAVCHTQMNVLNLIEILSALTLLLLMVAGYVLKKHQTKRLTILTPKNMETKTLRVEGMTCNHCKANIEKKLEEMSFVEKAHADLSNKTVTIEGENILLDKVIETIDSLGYKVKE